MVQLETVSPIFPVVVPVLKKIVPRVVAVLDPATVQFVTVLFEASAMNLIVLGVTARVVLTIERAFPPVFNPSIVTLSAPFRSISGPAIEPEIDRLAPPVGEIVIVVYEADPAPL